MTPEEVALKAYENDTNAERNIRETITSAYNNLKPQLNDIWTYENRKFPTFYNTLGGYGEGATDLSPTTQLRNAFNEVGKESTLANIARGIFDVRRAGMEDLIASALKQYEFNYQVKKDAYNRWWAQKQHEDQMREQAKTRAAMSASRVVAPIKNPYGNGTYNDYLVYHSKHGGKDPLTGRDIAGKTMPDGKEIAWLLKDTPAPVRRRAVNPQASLPRNPYLKAPISVTTSPRALLGLSF